MIGWADQDSVWPLFDGWCAANNVDPGSIDFARALNLIYHFAVRNASKEKKQEFDGAMTRAVSTYKLQEMAATRRNALSGSENSGNAQGVPEVTTVPNSTRNSKLPPRPAGWGDNLTATQQSLAAAQSLKVGRRAP